MKDLNFTQFLSYVTMVATIIVILAALSINFINLNMNWKDARVILVLTVLFSISRHYYNKGE